MEKGKTKSSEISDISQSAKFNRDESTTSAILTEIVRGIDGDPIESVQDLPPIIFKCEIKKEQIDSVNNLMKIMQQERISDSIGSSSDGKNALTSKVFTVEKNRAAFDALPKDLQELVEGAPELHTEGMQLVISNLNEKSMKLNFAIQYLKTLQLTSRLNSMTKINKKSTRMSSDSSEDIASLISSRSATTAVLEVDSDTERLGSEESSSDSDDKEAMGVLEKMNESLGVKSESLHKAVQKMHDSLLQENEAKSEQDGVYEALLSEKNDLLRKHEETQKENHQLKEDMEKDRQTSKMILKKTRKEKDNLLKKLKRLSGEVQSDNQSTPEKLDDKSAKKEISETDESIAKSDSAAEKIVEIVSVSQNGLEKRYEEVCQMLEDSERSLEIQQELNANITKMSDANRVKHNLEMSELHKVIQRLEDTNTKQTEEILRIKELERTKTDVLLKVVEEEKRKVQDECDTLKLDLDTALKALKEQKAESKRHLEAEVWKMKKAAKAAEKRRSSVEEQPNENQSKISELEKQLEMKMATVHLLQNEVEQLEISLKKSCEANELKQQAVEEMAVMFDTQSSELQAEKKKFEDLQREIQDSLEKEDAVSIKLKSLDEREATLETMRIEYETSSKDLMKRVTATEQEKYQLQMKVDELKEQLDRKTADYGKTEEEKTRFRRELEQASSPRRDKATQLESRLEAIQIASKAQQKRFEEELLSAKSKLDNLCQTNGELSKQIEELQEKAQSAEEIKLSLTEELMEARKNGSSVAELLSALQEEQMVLQAQNAEERAGLVDELIATKDKLKECMKSVSSPQPENIVENQLAKAVIDDVNEGSKAVCCPVRSAQNMTVPNNSPFPQLDPELQRFAEVIFHNQNYLYGIVGFFIYAILLHLYILL